MLECNICGGTGFAAAPNERLSRKKTPPRCVKCGSLERQRIGRAFAMAIREREAYKSYNSTERRTRHHNPERLVRLEQGHRGHRVGHRSRRQQPREISISSSARMSFRSCATRAAPCSD